MSRHEDRNVVVDYVQALLKKEVRRARKDFTTFLGIQEEGSDAEAVRRLVVPHVVTILGVLQQFQIEGGKSEVAYLKDVEGHVRRYDRHLSARVRRYLTDRTVLPDNAVGWTAVTPSSVRRLSPRGYIHATVRSTRETAEHDRRDDESRALMALVQVTEPRLSEPTE